MQKYQLIIGIDISKLTLSVCYMIGNRCHQLELTNDAKGIATLLKLADQYGVSPLHTLICCEHTGTYMDKLAYALKDSSITLWAVHPLIIKSYQLDLGRIKEDSVDAKKIMDFAATHQHKVTPYHHPGREARMRSDLFLVRKQLVKLRQQLLNMMDAHQTKAISNPTCTLIYGQLKSILDSYIQAVEKETELLMKKDQNAKHTLDVLQSIPGIGPVISQHLHLITEGFSKFNYKSLACHIGIAPFPRSSGTSIRYRPRTSKKAYQPLKADLHQGAICVIRDGQLFYQYYQHMIEKGKHHLWVINSIMNMILKLAFSLVRNNKLFDPKSFLKNKNSWNFSLEMS